MKSKDFFDQLKSETSEAAVAFLRLTRPACVEALGATSARPQAGGQRAWSPWN